MPETADIPPPWSRYPDEPPFSGLWRQGNAEVWMVYTWRPFWDALDASTQSAYLDRWNAPAAWREFLTGAWDDLD